MSLLQKQSAVCSAVQAQMEGALRDARGFDGLLAALEPAGREHVLGCANCRHVAEIHAASGGLLAGLRGGRRLSPGAWFAPRVMAVIAAKERELAHSPALAALLPKYASRLAWVASIALLITGSWVYGGGAKSPAATQPSMYIPESLFETQPAPPQTPDEVLMSLALTEN